MPMRWTAIAAFGVSMLIVAGATAAQSTKTCCKSPGVPAPGSDAVSSEFKDLPGPGAKCWIGEVNYFVYGFDKAPALGTTVLKIALFDKAGNPVRDMDIAGESGMPAMAGAHDSGRVGLTLEPKGGYVLPVSVAMPGDWEIRLTFSRNRIVLFRGRLTFGV